jgi:UDP-glucose 4-epimerase
MLGRHVLAALANRNISVAAVSRRRPGILPPDAKWQRWDLAQARTNNELDEMFGDVDALLHVGAMVPHGESHPFSAFLKANVEATLALGLWALQKQIPFVYVSGAVVYGDTNEPLIPETHATTYDCLGGMYGLTKFLGERILVEVEEKGLRLTVLRPSSIYGSGLDTGIIADFLKQAAAGETIEIKPPEDDRVDLIHAADVAEAMLNSLEREAYGTYNIASEAPATINEIAAACVECVGRGAVKIVADRAQREPTLRFSLGCDLARQAFNFSPRYGLADGICEMWRQSQAASIG